MTVPFTSWLNSNAIGTGSSSNTTVTAWLMAAISILVSSFVFYRILLRKKKTSQQQHEHKPITKRSRSFSFTSAGMVLGCFPERANVPETIINAALFFDDELPSEQYIVEKVVKPILAYERLNSVPTRTSATSNELQLLPCKNINPSKLVRSVTATATATSSSSSSSAVVDTIFEHIQDSLIGGRDNLPWWEVLVVKDGSNSKKKSGSGGGGACVFRIHHGLADGISLVKVFENVLSYEDGSKVQSPIIAAMMEKSRQSATKRNKTDNKVGFLFSRLWSIVKATFEVLTLGATKFDDDIMFSKSIHGKMEHSGNRSCVLFPSVDLDFIKELRKAGGVTVNDILMTAVSQSIHDYCNSQNCPVLSSGIQCRALLPVALPRPNDELGDKSSALRNKFSMVSSNFGVHCDDIIDRLHYIHQQTTSLKSSPVAYVQLLIQNTIPPLLPITFGQQTVYDVFTRHSLVFSNVPGPDRPCLFAGKVCTGVQMFYPNLIPQIGLISYAGKVHGNFVLDPDAIPDSQRLARYYGTALIELSNRLNVSPPKELQEIVKQQQQQGL